MENREKSFYREGERGKQRRAFIYFRKEKGVSIKRIEGVEEIDEQKV